jgi:hypothetical protein
MTESGEWASVINSYSLLQPKIQCAYVDSPSRNSKFCYSKHCLWTNVTHWAGKMSPAESDSSDYEKTFVQNLCLTRFLSLFIFVL